MWNICYTIAGIAVNTSRLFLNPHFFDAVLLEPFVIRSVVIDRRQEIVPQYPVLDGKDGDKSLRMFDKKRIMTDLLLFFLQFGPRIAQTDNPIKDQFAVS